MSLFIMNPTWHLGYPMPDNNFGFLDATYDISQNCRVCGIGKVQKAPFRLAKTPKFTGKKIFQLNWVFDQYFTAKEIWSEVFKEFGIAAGQVVLHKSGEVIPEVVQLIIEKVSDCDLDTTSMVSEICKVCNRIKYNVVASSAFPKFLGPIPPYEIFKTREYWGSGARAFQEIVISNELKSAVEKFGLQGIKFSPISPTHLQ